MVNKDVLVFFFFPQGLLKPSNLFQSSHTEVEFCDFGAGAAFLQKSYLEMQQRKLLFVRALVGIAVVLSQTSSGHKTPATKDFPACAPVTTSISTERTGQKIEKLLRKAHKLFTP